MRAADPIFWLAVAVLVAGLALALTPRPPVSPWAALWLGLALLGLAALTGGWP